MSFDSDWFGNCSNTFHEEQKQIVYAPRMGLLPIWHGAHPPYFDLMGRSVIDIGGGPVSLLLKCENLGRACVVDPAEYPRWVLDRYSECGIAYWKVEAEDMNPSEREYDEAWIYNVLTHTRSPQKIIENALAIAKTVRIFEWLEDEPRPGHPQTLHAEEINEWVGARGFTANINENGAVGMCYYGVFSSPQR